MRKSFCERRNFLGLTAVCALALSSIASGHPVPCEYQAAEMQAEREQAEAKAALEKWVELGRQIYARFAELVAEPISPAA